MQAIKEMNRKNANYVAKEVMEHLKKIEELLGVSIADKGGNFDSSSFVMKIEFIPKSVSEEFNVLPNEIDYAKNLKLFDQIDGFNGVDSSNIGKEIVYNGDKMIFIGLSSKRSNASFLGRNVKSGGLYKLKNEVALKKALGLAK